MTHDRSRSAETLSEQMSSKSGRWPAWGSLGWVSLAVLTAGLMLALRILPEWSTAELQDSGYFVGQMEEMARNLDIALVGDRSEVQLVIPSGRGHLSLEKQVRVAQRSVWLQTEGRLQASFAPEGELVGLTWMPLAFRDFLELSIGREESRRHPEDLAPLLLWPGERLGEPLETTVAGANFQLIPLIGAETASYLEIAVSSNHVFEVSRRRGEAKIELGRISSRLMGRFWVRLILRATLFVLVVAVFLFLLAKRRVDFRDGLYLMALALLVPWPNLFLHAVGGVSWWQVLPGMVFASLFLLLLWSVSESWARTTEPDFTTSLDFLRAGHLGQRGGRALWTGWIMGSGLAGWNLICHTVGHLLPGVYAEEASVPLPVFGPTGHPFYQGPMVAGCVLLAVPVAHRLLPAGWRFVGASAVGACLLLPSSAFASLPFALMTSWVVALWLLLTYRRFGLAALLVASTTSLLLAAVAILWPYATRAPVSFGLSLLIVLWIPVLGWIGSQRPPELGDQALVPGFVQRVEEERRVKYEMALLARMQVGMLPGGPPQIEGYELAAVSELASEAGGDFYDFVWDDEGRLWLAVGDVAGHGYACTIELAMIKAAIHSLVGPHDVPSEVLTRIDQVLRSSRKVRSFSTLMLLRLEPERGLLTLANAGHPFPWVRRAQDAVSSERVASERVASDRVSSDRIEEVVLPGLPLGQGPPRDYHDVQVALHPGDALLVASDGLFESVDSRKDTYGFERPRQLFDTLSDMSAEQILQRLIADWQTFLAAQPIADDTSLVVLRRSPSSVDVSPNTTA